MNIYMAAIHSNGYKHTARYDKLNEYEQYVVNQYPHLLESYHYVHKPQFVEAMRSRGDKVFIDSGAFSAYTLGVTIDIEEYCQYIKTNTDIIREEDGVVLASVLDGIGDPLLTYQNQKRMEQLGVTPLPCFHAGEDERYLQYYLDNYPYLTLGGMVGSSTKQLIIWLDRMWSNYIIDEHGRPRKKIHAFGITSVEIMKKYPWHSVDSSSWVQSAAFGTIITPDFGTLQVSEKSPSRHTWGQHLTTLTAIEQEHLRAMLHEQGFDYERLSKVYESRAVYNVWSFGEVNRRINLDKSPIFEPVIQELF